jgi:uncharacterized protein (DUF2147 family)
MGISPTRSNRSLPRAIVTIGSAVAAMSSSILSAAPSGDPTGIWIEQGAVEVYKCGTQFCGRIAWIKEPNGPDGKPMLDDKNSDPKLRQRPMCGLPLIGGLTPDKSGDWRGGWIYNPDDGSTYSVELALKGANKLLVTGYLGFRFLSETFEWRRAPTSLAKCSSSTSTAI